jgi:hypothetical protein
MTDDRRKVRVCLPARSVPSDFLTQLALYVMNLEVAGNDFYRCLPVGPILAILAILNIHLLEVLASDQPIADLRMLMS